MKKVTKNKVTNPEKRDLFVELKEGVSALTEERQGKRSLRKNEMSRQSTGKTRLRRA